MRTRGVLLGIALLNAPLSAQAIPEAEYQERRARLMGTISDGIVLLHARSGAKEEDQRMPTYQRRMVTGTGTVGGSLIMPLTVT